MGIYSTTDLEGDVANADAALRELSSKASSLDSELASAKRKLKDAEAQLRTEQDARRGDAGTIKKLQAELEDTRVDKEGLEQELALIVDQIGFLSEYSK